MQNNALLKPVPIRFSRKTKDRVRKAAQRFQLPTSEIIRRAVEQQLPIWETDGKITLHAEEHA